METTELIDFLRESLTIEIEMDDSHECESRYITCSVTLRLGDEVIATDYSSVNVE